MNAFALLLAPPVLAALLAAAVTPYRRAVGWANGVLSLVSLGAALALWRELLDGRVATSGPGEFLRADALSTCSPCACPWSGRSPPGSARA